jgi:ribosomal protein L37AE/L43A
MMRYATRCAMRCVDNRERPRNGDQWVHIWGTTYWVCRNCAEHFSRLAGIPTTTMVKLETRRREARQQLSLDLTPETHIPERQAQVS